MAHTRPNVWQLQSRRDVQGLIEALHYSDPEVRKRAATALRVIDATQAVPALKAALRDEADVQTRSSMALALHELDHRTDIKGLISAQDVKGLIEALKSRHPQNVVAAARALGQLGDRLAVEPLVMLFQSSSSLPQVRLAAAEALLELKSAPAVVTLLGALRRDSWQVRRNAAAVLGQIQATWAVDPLIAALDDAHPVVSEAAATALRRIGTAEAVVALRAHGLMVEKMPPTEPVEMPAEAHESQESPPTQPAVELSGEARSPVRVEEVTPFPEPEEDTGSEPSPSHEPLPWTHEPVERLPDPVADADSVPAVPASEATQPAPLNEQTRDLARLAKPIRKLIAFFARSGDSV